MKFYLSMFAVFCGLVAAVRVLPGIPLSAGVESADDRAVRVAHEFVMKKSGWGMREVSRFYQPDGALVILGDVNADARGRPVRWVLRFNAARDLVFAAADGAPVFER